MAKTKNSLVELTADDLIARCHHSYTDKLFVEGVDDEFWLNKIKERLNGTFDVFPCGGRESLLKIWEAITAKPPKKGRILFLADQDTWLYYPDKFEERFQKKYQNQPNLIFTAGYCFENDLYADGQKALHLILTREEEQKIKRCIDHIIDWYVFMLEKTSNDPELDINFLNDEIFNLRKEMFTDEYLQRIGYQNPSEIEHLKYDLKNLYPWRLRGKYFFDLYFMVIKMRNDKRHFSDHQLKYLCFVMGLLEPTSHIQRMMNAIQSFFPAPKGTV